MEDVQSGLALHAGLHRELVEVLQCLVDAVPPELQGDRPVLVLAQEDGAARLHPGAIAHRLGDDDLALWAYLGRSEAIEWDPGTKRGKRLGLTHAGQYNHFR